MARDKYDRFFDKIVSRYRRTQKRKPAKKKFGAANKTVGAGRYTAVKWNPLITFAPDSVWTVFKFRESFLLSSGTALGQRTYYGNAPQDPNLTSPGAGIRPLGFDQWSAIYDRGYCSRSRILVQVQAFASDSTSQNVPLKVVVLPSQFPSALGGMDLASTRPRARSKIISNQDNSRAYFNMTATTRAITGERFDETDQTFIMVTPPTATTNPNTQWYWHVAVQPVNQATTVSVAMDVQILYNVRMYRRKFIAQSGSSSV